jgi:NAD(P)-dependent dehydrogenase (short-subunit alcohol dehydrogenase family)
MHCPIHYVRAYVAPSRLTSAIRLNGKRALVTGDQGIEQVIALRFAKDGVDVIVNYRKNPGQAEETWRQSGEKKASSRPGRYGSRDRCPAGLRMLTLSSLWVANAPRDSCS